MVIVAFGDSTTAPRGDLKVYADVLLEALPKHGIKAEVINAGVGGNSTEDGMKRFESQVLAREPDLVILQFGINDASVDVCLHAVGSRVDLGQYEKNLTQMVRELHAAKARVILMTPNPCRWTAELLRLYGQPPYQPKDPDGYNVLLKKFAAAVRKIAATEKTKWVDVYALFQQYGRRKGMDDLLLDGMHPNAAGHAMIANALIPLVREMGQGSTLVNPPP